MRLILDITNLKWARWLVRFICLMSMWQIYIYKGVWFYIYIQIYIKNPVLHNKIKDDSSNMHCDRKLNCSFKYQSQ